MAQLILLGIVAICICGFVRRERRRQAESGKPTFDVGWLFAIEFTVALCIAFAAFMDGRWQVVGQIYHTIVGAL